MYRVPYSSADGFDLLWQFLMLMRQNNLRMCKTIATAAGGYIWRQNVLISSNFTAFLPLQTNDGCPSTSGFCVGIGLGWSFRRDSSPAIYRSGHTCWNLKWFCWDKGVPPSVCWLFVALKGLWGRNRYCPGCAGCCPVVLAEGHAIAMPPSGPPGLGRWLMQGLRWFVSLEQKLQTGLRGLSDENSLGNWCVSVEIFSLAELAFLREKNICSDISQLL